MKYLQYAPKIPVVLRGISQLIPAGAQCRGGRATEQIQLLLILQVHVVQLVCQDSLNTMGRTQHPGDAACIPRSLNDSLSAGVNDGGGSSRLSNDAGAYEFAHAFILQP
ncbi:hypothetical protein SDC9_131900 [bioreactor metagenome]|uniref:Uncharacterized protein n=1 Tax=bioreactor metagenome TaxID=1076179 RepID=A0A645D665_9ZZZZ